VLDGTFLFYKLVGNRNFSPTFLPTEKMQESAEIAKEGYYILLS
jgi:hypothetical protein